MLPLRSLILTCFVISCSAAAHAESRVLLAADDPKQITEVELAQVQAPSSSRWLSVHLKARARLALVTSFPLETADSGDAWLRALDFVTRERVAAPPGPLAACPDRASFPIADSGLPEWASIREFSLTDADSDVDLQRSLSNGGVDVARSVIDEFTANNTGPFQIHWYDAPASGGATTAVRWVEQQATNDPATIQCAGQDALPITWLELGNGVLLPTQATADPSEFGVTYFAHSASTDYASARASWVASADRALLEAAGTPALFSWTTFAEGQIPPEISRYFSTLSAKQADPCMSQVTAARIQGSRDAADFSCAGGDDLAQTLTELDFDDARLTRLLGTSATLSALRSATLATQNPRIQATDFDVKDCASNVTIGQSPVTDPSGQSGSSALPGAGAAYDDSSSSIDRTSTTTVDTSVNQTYVAPDSGSCDGSDLSSSDDSCSGDSSASDSSSSDSCSGDSSSDDSKSDSCSGDSDSSSSDSSGCGSNDKSGYDGDTCSGNSANSTSQGLAAPSPSRPRRVRLSLLTLLVAGLSLPLRRRLK